MSRHFCSVVCAPGILALAGWATPATPVPVPRLPDCKPGPSGVRVEPCEENNRELREGHIKFWIPPPVRKKP
jgi:hypothetical protein